MRWSEEDSASGTSGEIAVDPIDAQPPSGPPFQGKWPARRAGAMFGAVVGAPLGWIGVGSIAEMWPASQRGIDEQIVLTLVATLSAGLAGAFLGGYAIRHPWLVIPAIALLTQAFGIVLFCSALSLQASQGPFGYLLLVPFGAIGVAPITPYVIVGAVAFATLFEALGRQLISESSAAAARARNAHDGAKLAWAIGLTALWYAGPIVFFSLFPLNMGY